jgi:TonB family protein
VVRALIDSISRSRGSPITPAGFTARLHPAFAREAAFELVRHGVDETLARSLARRLIERNSKGVGVGNPSFTQPLFPVLLCGYDERVRESEYTFSRPAIDASRTHATVFYRPSTEGPPPPPFSVSNASHLAYLKRSSNRWVVEWNIAIHEETDPFNDLRESHSAPIRLTSEDRALFHAAITHLVATKNLRRPVIVNETLRGRLWQVPEGLIVDIERRNRVPTVFHIGDVPLPLIAREQDALQRGTVVHLSMPGYSDQHARAAIVYFCDRKEAPASSRYGLLIFERSRVWNLVSDQLPPPPTFPLRVGGDVTPPRLLNRVEAPYTTEARRKRIQGIVIVEAIINRSGKVIRVRVLKPLPDGLDRSAADAVRQWTFLPGTLNGSPVDVVFNLTVNFRL